MADLASLVGSARPPERTVSLCLRGDLVGRAEELDAQIVAMRKRPGHAPSLGGDGTEDLVAEHEAVREEMLGATVTLRLRALNARRVKQIVAECPPDPDDPTARRLGYDSLRVSCVMARECCYEVTAPDGLSGPMTGDMWDHLIGPMEEPGSGVLSTAQIGALDEALSGLNFGAVSVPFSRNVSPTPPG